MMNKTCNRSAYLKSWTLVPSYPTTNIEGMNPRIE